MKLPSSVSGFTLVELLVVASLMAVFFSIGVARYNDFNRRQVIEQAGLELKNNLRLAQNKASIGEKDSTVCTDAMLLYGWYVSFDSGSYRIYGNCAGTEYSSTTINLNSRGISVSNPPATPIRFQPINRGVEGATTITIYGSGGRRSVTVTTAGEIK